METTPHLYDFKFLIEFLDKECVPPEWGVLAQCETQEKAVARFYELDRVGTSRCRVINRFTKKVIIESPAER